MRLLGNITDLVVLGEPNRFEKGEYLSYYKEIESQIFSRLKPGVRLHIPALVSLMEWNIGDMAVPYTYVKAPVRYYVNTRAEELWSYIVSGPTDRFVSPEYSDPIVKNLMGTKLAEAMHSAKKLKDNPDIYTEFTEINFVESVYEQQPEFFANINTLYSVLENVQDPEQVGVIFFDSDASLEYKKEIMKLIKNEHLTFFMFDSGINFVKLCKGNFATSLLRYKEEGI